MKLLIDCSPPTIGGYIKYAHEVGFKVIVTDCESDKPAAVLADNFYKVSRIRDKERFLKEINKIIKEEKIDIVIPLLQEALPLWNDIRGTFVLISPKRTIDIFIDKWKTYQWFENNNIKTPLTQLEKVNPFSKILTFYKILKPRFGRGSRKVVFGEEAIIQQYIDGIEYTVDVLCNRKGEAIYIVPRRRERVESGIIFEGLTVEHILFFLSSIH